MIDLALNASACGRKMSMRDYKGQYYVCILEPRAVFHFLVAHDYSTEGPWIVIRYGVSGGRPSFSKNNCNKKH